ncbi:MAG: hypothetical protein JXA21_18330 [Anaerolineae bacterium]|nr:hypothetical protein [Anaerolineae bacterium]
MFQFYIFRESLDRLELRHEATKAFAILEKLDTNKASFTIGVDEVAVYDWDKQTFTLTEAATLALLGVRPRKGEIEEGAEKLLALEENLGWGQQLSRQLYTRAFVAKVAGEFRYGGIFLDALSQRPLNYPVARISQEGNQAIIALLPMQIPFFETDPAPDGKMEAFRVTEKAQEDAQYLESQSGFFKEWITKMAIHPLTQNRRALIRDERIKQRFAAAGKLRCERHS